MQWCLVTRHGRLFVTPWTVARQLHCPWGLSRQENWSGLPFPSLGCNGSVDHLDYYTCLKYRINLGARYLLIFSLDKGGKHLCPSHNLPESHGRQFVLNTVSKKLLHRPKTSDFCASLRILRGKDSTTWTQRI